ncbi:MAG: chemotaxis protein CheW [Candidatus Nitricoxidivorans perseverans]|uniref:Chemotaxis protein CheW n=1 Tax=Candidatus Nitricoxidivorans perseverans TaxID=2975601 RepID=A0AA49FJ37_9PROT|nr:MAG: chemotaxis protein CheW [Candidatus Nitricoxidivorans perseverans]
MAKRISLREFQESLARRLTSAQRGETARALLGVESGTDHWLIDLSDSGEVVPLPPLTPVPLTRHWFSGIANVRGTLYSVVDLSAFRGGEPARRNSDARLLLVGARHGTHSALLVDRTLGLKALDGFAVEPAADGAPAWTGERHIDAQGHRWTRLNLKALLDDPEFLDIGL